MKQELFNDKELELIRLCQENIPLCADPFGEIARQLNVEEKWIYSILQKWQKNKALKKFKAILYHHKSGYRSNGMSVWEVPEHRIAEIGKVLASYPQISHCYHRPKLPDWPYNIYGMLHGKNRAEVENLAQKISTQIEISNYAILYSVREFKKSSMKYFVPEVEE